MDLVLRERLGAKRRLALSNATMTPSGRRSRDQLDEHRDEAERRVGGPAVRRGHRLGQRVERAVQQAVAVDDGDGARGHGIAPFGMQSEPQCVRAATLRVYPSATDTAGGVKWASSTGRHRSSTTSPTAGPPRTSTRSPAGSRPFLPATADARHPRCRRRHGRARAPARRTRSGAGHRARPHPRDARLHPGRTGRRRPRHRRGDAVRRRLVRRRRRHRRLPPLPRPAGAVAGDPACVRTGRRRHRPRVRPERLGDAR